MRKSPLKSDKTIHDSEDNSSPTRKYDDARVPKLSAPTPSRYLLGYLLLALSLPITFIIFMRIPWKAISTNLDHSDMPWPEAGAEFPSQRAPFPNKDTKHILYYTTNGGERKGFKFGTGHQAFLNNECPVHNCIAHNYDDASNFSSYDAVLFSTREKDFNITAELSSINKWRRPHQRFIFHNLENQNAKIVDLEAMNSFFNWTMTFKWDSDFPRPYGWFDLKSKPSFYPSNPKQWTQYNEKKFLSSLPSRDKDFHALARRPGKVAWIVSKCVSNSKRENYVRELQKYIPVDIFGRCGKAQCDQKHTITGIDNCTRRVQEDYKFYLALENSFCNDYVSEKFFRFRETSVVISLGQANYSAISPPHSFIDILDFPSPKDLAKYLLHLDQHDAKYLSYFWWKDYYKVHYPFTGQGKTTNFRQSMCQLCEKLHDKNTLGEKTYDKISDWWRVDGQCEKRLPELKRQIAVA